jgi:thymidylate synthase ThyX
MTIKAKVVADSVVSNAPRLTTMVLTYPRYIHAQFMTHRVFSRNASSSRAIPTQRIIDAVTTDPVVPLNWRENKKGMQGGEIFTADREEAAEVVWQRAMEAAIKAAEELMALGAHKQLVNRILEPFAHITVVVSSTKWENFFRLRTHAAGAQDEIDALATAMREAMDASVPRQLEAGEWHLPFVSIDEIESLDGEAAVRSSVARCARVSYNRHDGVAPTREDDDTLYNTLLTSKHYSPFEHQALPSFGVAEHLRGNFGRGWIQYRKTLDGEADSET